MDWIKINRNQQTNIDWVSLKKIVKNWKIPFVIQQNKQNRKLFYVINQIYGWQITCIVNINQFSIQANGYFVRTGILSIKHKFDRFEVCSYLWKLNSNHSKINMLLNIQNGYIYMKYHSFNLHLNNLSSLIDQINQQFNSYAKLHLPHILKIIQHQPNQDQKQFVQTLKSYICSANKYSWFNQMTNIPNSQRLQYYKNSKQSYIDCQGEVSAKYGPNYLVKSFIKVYQHTTPPKLTFSIPSDHQELKLVKSWISKENQSGKNQNSQIIYLSLKKQAILSLEDKWTKFSEDYLIGKRQQHQKFDNMILDTVEYGKMNINVEFIFVNESYRLPLMRERSIMQNVFNKEEHMNIARYIYLLEEYQFNLCTRFISFNQYISLNQFLARNALTMRVRSKFNIIYQLSRVALYMRQHGVVFNNINPSSIKIKKRTVKVFDMRFVYHKKYQNRQRQWKVYFPYRTNQKMSYSQKSDVAAILMLIYLLLIGKTPYYCIDSQAINEIIYKKIPLQYCFECLPPQLRLLLIPILNCLQIDRQLQQIIYLDWLHIIIRSLCNFYKI